MKKIDRHTLSMWRVVRQHLDAHGSVWMSHRPFVDASNELTGAIQKAKDVLQVQSTGTKGVSGERRAQQLAAINKVVAIAGCAAAYALKTGNHVLFEQVREQKGVLRRFGQHVLTATLSRMMEAAAAHSEALADYGITDDAINDARTAIALMEKAQSSVRSSIAAKKAMTDSIPEIMESGRLALAKMDRMMRIFEAQDAALVAGYKTARGIMHVNVKVKGDDPPAAAA
jgi:hypothetical protein